MKFFLLGLILIVSTPSCFAFFTASSTCKSIPLQVVLGPTPSKDYVRFQNELILKTRALLSVLGVAATAVPKSVYAYGAVEIPKKKKEGKIKVSETSLGIKFIDVKVGDGPNPGPGDIVSINYLAFLSNGTEFDSAYAKKGLTFKYGSKVVIPGLEDVLETMRPGGQRTCTIPGKHIIPVYYIQFIHQHPPRASYFVLSAKYAFGSKGVCVGGSCLVPPNEDLKYVVTLKKVAANYN